MNNTNTVTVEPKNSRLRSLDLLRGADMLFLAVIGPLLTAFNRSWGLPKGLTEQLTHADWIGFTLWDLIMPLFIFMCGAAIPFALPKRLKDGRPGWTFWKHILGRVLLLWTLGMLIQGNLLSFVPAKICFYNNTLQAIAAGYLIAALTFLVPWQKLRLALPILLAAIYGIALVIFGDYTPDGNAAIRLERVVFPNNHDGYGWMLTTLMFGAMTLCGMQATELLRSKFSPMRKFVILLVAGTLVLLAGLVLGIWEPAIKRIYTVAFTAQAMGWSILALAALYLVADVFRLVRGNGIITLFGQYALTAYLCHELFAPGFDALACRFTYGCPNIFGTAPQPFIETCVVSVLIISVLYVRKRLDSREIK